MGPLTPHAPLDRRGFLGLAGLAGVSWLTPVGHLLARAAEAPANAGKPAQSIILLWLQGGPSQLETFDPHPGTTIAAGTGAVATAVRDVKLATGLERTAEEMGSIALVRSMVSKEGDHERGTYTMKTGFRPDPTVVHPSIGAICCHELPAAGTDIPRHVSILPGQWPARGGYFGEAFDAFKTGDPAEKVPDTVPFVPPSRDEERLKHLDVVEGAFARGRRRRVEATMHRATIAGARKMMSSEQLRAFEVTREPLALRRAYGETPFGRGCLAARRLIEVGVRCVEVTLGGWDTHVNNHAQVRDLLAVLDPAFSALVRDLRERGLLGRTLVVCAGEFGRTPTVNGVGGRDHWPTGFSVALAGGGTRGGRIVGATDPAGKDKPTDPVTVGDLHATVLTAVGINPKKVHQTPIGRTVRFSEGQPVKALLEKS
ncbi:MAG TPA: DUF1501 domain-containing protein [Gemmataceae bacterium]|nr:DUF1501 domain-containing protein [Gemmataceae bacterium]